MSSDRIDKRRFLKFVVGGSVAASQWGCSHDGRAGKSVVVLGAGLAGLTAAYQLMNQGYDVTVLEGQNRVGGRVLTVRDGFQAGGFAEMGATRFETHAYTNKYVQRFGLSLVPYDSGTRAFAMRGQRFLPPPDGRPWPITDMSDAERANPFAFFERYLVSGFGRLGDIFSAAWPNAVPSALALDAVTFGQYLRNQGASAGWVDWFCAQEGNIKRINACAGFAVESVTGARWSRASRAATTVCPRLLPTRSATASSSAARSCASTIARAT
jgi:monoamine oxidase